MTECHYRTRADGSVSIKPKIVHGAPNGRVNPGAGRIEWFKDYEHGPEMVVVPPGSFVMGSPDVELRRQADEWPQHKVMIRQPFAVGRHAITRGEFATFVKITGYKMDDGAHVWSGTEPKFDPRASWRNPGFTQDDSHPVVCVSWNDATAYAAWLSEASDETYRLLSEAQREYVVRAGTRTPFWWGPKFTLFWWRPAITPKWANYNGNFSYANTRTKGDYRQATVPVGSFEANPWGLFNVHGNVWEWCEDVWHANYNGAPTDGSAWLEEGDANRRVLRGGSWVSGPDKLRSARRSWQYADSRHSYFGFRLARTITLQPSS